MKTSPHVLVGFVCLLGGLLSAWAQEGLPEARVLPDPSSPPGGGQSGSVTLAMVSSKVNQITDEDAWWERNGLEKPAIYLRFPAVAQGAIPDGAPKSYQGKPLMAVWSGSRRRFFVYGEQIYKARYLLAEAEGGGSIEYAFDAKSYGTAAWADIVDGILYLSNTPGNLSAEGGRGARIFAIDLESNSIRWASPENTCHGQFLVIAGSVVCGYGFTAEPDFIYVLDRFDGSAIQAVKLETAADWLIQKEDLLYVRCYNRDEVYRIEIRD